MDIKKPTCFYCGASLIWDSNSDCNCYDEDDCAIASYYHCPQCGRSYEIFDPSKEEREGVYKDYWNVCK